MKLSEAILLGSIGTEQAFGKLMNEGRTCAMGAAGVALGFLQYDTLSHHPSEVILDSAIYLAYPFLNDKVECPVCRSKVGLMTIYHVISWHLNDQHKWPRPKIAAWVATIEPQETQQDAPSTSEPCLTRED